MNTLTRMKSFTNIVAEREHEAIEVFGPNIQFLFLRSQTVAPSEPGTARPPGFRQGSGGASPAADGPHRAHLMVAREDDCGSWDTKARL